MKKAQDYFYSPLILMIMTVIAFSFIWEFLFHKNLLDLFGVGDSLGLVAHYADSMFYGPFAEDFLYSTHRLGGSAVSPLDFPVYYQLFSLLGITPILAINFSIILSQACIFYFIVRCLPRNSIFLSILIGVLFSFNPVLSWRIQFGHLNIVWFVVSLITFFGLLFLTKREKTNTLDYFLAFFVFANVCHSLSMAQMFVYTVFLVLLSLCFLKLEVVRKWIKIDLKFVLLIFSVICFSLNEIVNILSIIPTLSRSISENLIYSYNVQTILDFFSSFFYDVNVVNSGRGYFFLHETNLGYGIVPLVLIGLWIQKPRSKMFLFNIFIFIVSCILSSNIPFLSKMLVEFIPILGSFRCPSRIFVLVFYIHIICISGHILGKSEEVSKKETILAVLFILFIVFAGRFVVVDWLLIPVIFLALYLYIRERFKYIYILIVLVGFNLSGFENKIQESSFTYDDYRSEKKFFELVKEKANLRSNFLDSTVTTYLSKTAVNQFGLYGLNGLDGYLYPTERFSQFYNYFYRRGASNYQFYFSPASDNFLIFQRIFNVTHLIKQLPGKKMELIDLNWKKSFYSPQKVIVVDSFKERMDKLIHIKDFDNISIVEIPIENLAGKCDEIKLRNQSRSHVSFHVKNTKRCLIVLPISYSHFLKATDKKSGKVFNAIPVNQVMTGFLIPAGEHDLFIKAKSVLSSEILFKLLSLFLFITLLGYNFKMRKSKN